jgi:hypothetical protein
MDVEEYIHQKVKLFKNKTYFKLFQTILINLSKNITIYRKQYSLSGRMENNNSNNGKKEKISFWFYIMKIVLDKLKAKEKAFFIKNNLDVNPLVFSYLVKLCKIKMVKLEKLSISENAPMENLIRLYLDLCQKEINPNIEDQNEEQKSTLEIVDNKNNKLSPKKTNQIKGTKNDNRREEEDLNENDVKKKYGIGKIRLTYNRSLCRLFIGDTDEKSVQKKHLMGITVKKDRTLKINGIQMGKSESYAKRIINEIGEEKGYYIDDDLHKILNKFKREQKFLDDYKKNLKLEQNENVKKLKTNSKFNKKGIKILGINSPKGIYKSPTQVNFNSFRTLKSSKSRKYILSNLHTNNNKTKNKNEKIEVKLFPKTPIINKKIIFDGFEGKRKISKNILNKFKKYKNSNTSLSSRKIDFHKYLINKKDFFYNNEFEI